MRTCGLVLRCVVVGLAVAASAGLAQTLSAEQIEQRLREAAAVKDDTERLRSFDALAATVLKPVGPGWKIDERKSPVTDLREVTLTLEADAEVRVGGRMVRPVIRMFGGNGGVRGEIAIGNEAMSETLRATKSIDFRVDRFLSRRLACRPDQATSESLVMIDPILLLAHGQCGNQLAMELVTAGTERVIASFSLANTREAATAVLALSPLMPVGVATQCPRTESEDRAWRAIELIAENSRMPHALPPDRRNTVIFAVDSYQRDQDGRPDLEVDVNWWALRSLMKRYPNSKLRIKSFLGRSHLGDLSHALVQDEVRQALISADVDISRASFVDATIEESESVNRYFRLRSPVAQCGLIIEFEGAE
jgi:hypothetical protein